MSYDGCCNYFRKKIHEWENVCDVSDYISFAGEDNLCKEFQQDDDFKRIVCPFISQFANRREEALILTIGNVINPSSVFFNILVAAVLKACGYDRQSEGYLKLLIFSVLVSLGIFVINEYTKDKNRKRR